MKTDDKYKNLERVNFWVTNADTKVSYLLALQGIIITLVFTSGIRDTFIKTMSYKFSFNNIDWLSIVRFIEGLSLYVAFFLILISIFNIYKTLKARLSSDVFNENGLETNSLIFFETIANRKYVDFVNDQNNLSEGEINNQIDSQVFINSKICQTKFRHYNLALKYCCISLLPVFIYTLIRIKYGS